MVRYVVLAAVLVVVGSGSTGFAQDEKSQPVRSKLGGVLKDRMSRVVDFIYEEQPLIEVVEELKSKLDIPVLLDVKALEEASITPDTPVSMELPKVRADLGLELLLEPLDLTVDYSKGLPRITTKEKARTIVQTWYYDVRDLIATVEEDEVNRRRQFGNPSPEKKEDGSKPALAESLNARGPAMMSAKDAMAKPAAKSTEFHPSDTVRKLVMDTVDPNSWEERGGLGRVTILAGVMVVVQTSDGHDQIEETLSQVRAILKMPPGAQLPARPAGADVLLIQPDAERTTRPPAKPAGGDGADDPFGR